MVTTPSFFPSSNPPLSYTVPNDTLIGSTALTYLRNHVPLNTRPSQPREKFRSRPVDSWDSERRFPRFGRSGILAGQQLRKKNRESKTGLQGV
ncbi:hypothetical protein IFM46972_00371 [Aspergillus udagawae]|uniref:Uncharacterized protein n=1 Tax=Aspergillus udagawae TaxID=91492 RepID=A0A8H3MYK5_9EURO|nr:hypothetical protein IFM46972_00371 [Aspergillus udagawae]